MLAVLCAELRGLGRSRQRRGRGTAPRDHLRDFIKIAGAHEALVRDGAITEFLSGELFLLELGLGGHGRLGIAGS